MVVDCEVKLAPLLSFLDDLKSRLVVLNRCRGNIKGFEFHDDNLPPADPAPAHRALEKLSEDLDYLSGFLRDRLDDMRVFIGLDGYQERSSMQHVSPTLQYGLRQRKVAKPNSGSTSIQSSLEESSSGFKESTLSWLMALRVRRADFSPLSFRLSPISSQRVRTFCLHQSTVQTLVFGGAVLGAVMVGISVMQKRPDACELEAFAFDDGFWALVSQCLVQLTSLYCTVVPVIRDKNMPVPAFWFWMASWSSFAVGILTPILYALGLSWRVIALTNFASGITTLLASLLLAGASSAYSWKPILDKTVWLNRPFSGRR